MRTKPLVMFIAIALVTFVAVTSWAQDDKGSPPPARPPAPAAASKDAVPPPSVTIIGAGDAHGVLGRDVRSPADENIGRIANKGDSITLELTKDQVMAAPEYKEDTPIVVLGASGSLQPLQFDP